MSIINVLWWLIFITFAIIGQSIFEGIDFLIIGFIFLLQEEDLKQFLIIAPILFLIHEGMSTFYFGSTLLWYVATFLLLILGRCLLEIENFLFMFLFSSTLAFTHIIVFVLMASLQDIDYSIHNLLDDSVLQALIMPCIWYVLSFTRPQKSESVVL